MWDCWEDAADIQTIMEETSDKVDGFAEELFQHMLWEWQRYNVKGQATKEVAPSHHTLRIEFVICIINCLSYCKQ